MFLFTTPPIRDAAPASPVIDAIRHGADQTGVGFDYLLATAQRESSLDPKAQARSSSASGLFQFVEQTWLGLIKSEGARAGLPDYARAVSTRPDGTHGVDDPALRQTILELRHDPEVASVMAGALTQKNRDVLLSELGREPSSADLYAAHFLGARGAAELIRTAQQNPDQPIAADFPDAAAANRTIFFDRQGRARGAGEVYALLAQSQAGTAAAPAFAPDRPVGFAHQDGPAFHSLFQSDGRRGPVSDAVANLWHSTRSGTGTQTAALSYFPNSRGDSIAVVEPAEQPRTVILPLPPRRPEPVTARVDAGKPLDLSKFMNWRKS
jgi:hypothetical protein